MVTANRKHIDYDKTICCFHFLDTHTHSLKKPEKRIRTPIKYTTVKMNDSITVMCSVCTLWPLDCLHATLHDITNGDEFDFDRFLVHMIIRHCSCTYGKECKNDASSLNMPQELAGATENRFCIRQIRISQELFIAQKHCMNLISPSNNQVLLFQYLTL